MLGRMEPEAGVTYFRSFVIAIQGRSVIAAHLDISDSVPGRTVVLIVDVSPDRHEPALVIRAYRHDKHDEQNILRRLDADDGARADEQRPDVQAGARAVRGHEIPVQLYRLADRVGKQLLRRRFHAKTRSRIDETPCVLVRPEDRDRAVLLRERLQSFEAFLAIVQAGRGDVDLGKGFMASLDRSPRTVFALHPHVSAGVNVTESEIFPIHVFFQAIPRFP